MISSRKSPLLAAAAFSLACGSSSGSPDPDGSLDPDPSFDPCASPELLDWDGTTLTAEVSAADVDYCDPLFIFSETGRFGVEVRWNHVSDLLYDDRLVIGVGSPLSGGEGEVGRDYAIGPMPDAPDLETTLVIQEVTLGRTCVAAAGRVAVSTLPIRGLVEGTYEVTEWDAEMSEGSCPAAPISGRFAVLRD